MNRKSFLRNSALATGALLLSKQQLMAAIFQTQPWKIKMLTKETGIFTEKGGTILFQFNKEGIIVVDSQFPEQSAHLIEELKKQSALSFKLLINTHHHGDHTSGNISFKGLVENVLAHENSKANQQRVAKEKNTEDKQLYPDQVFGTVWSQKTGGQKISLHYFGAGHTNGDALIEFEKEHIVHMGDLVFNRRHPFVDRSAGANMKSWITVLDKAVDKFSKKATYVFGHAADGYEVTGSAEDLKAFRNYLDKTLTYVESAIKSGKSKDEILKTTVIPGAEEWKGDGIDRPLTAAYEELTT